MNKNDNKISDETLVENIKKGDDAVFQELMRRYIGVIFNFVRQYAGNNEDAEDITQDSFFKVWKNLHRFKEGKTSKPWLFTIARNTAFDYIKKKRAITFSKLDDADNETQFSDFLHDDEPLPDELFARAQTAEAMSSIQKELHPDYQSTLFMRYNENMTFNEIAEIMGKSINTVKSWHHRALQKLKELLLHQNETMARITRQ